MPYRFKSQSCRFFLNGPFTEFINDHLQNLSSDPIDGVRLSFQCSSNECYQSLTIEIDSEGNLSKLSVVDSETDTADTIFDFSGNKFYFHNEPLDLICGQPIFHMLQHSIPFHNQAGHYSVTVTAL